MRPVLLKEAQGDSAHIVQPSSDAMPPPEQTGDRYQLQGEIARGGMGAVLRGRDVDLGRDLAVKVLLEKYVDRPGSAIHGDHHSTAPARSQAVAHAFA
jgi:hypothetical protein